MWAGTTSSGSLAIQLDAERNKQNGAITQTLQKRRIYRLTALQKTPGLKVVGRWHPRCTQILRPCLNLSLGFLIGWSCAVWFNQPIKALSLGLGKVLIPELHVTSKVSDSLLKAWHETCDLRKRYPKGHHIPFPEPCPCPFPEPCQVPRV